MTPTELRSWLQQESEAFPHGVPDTHCQNALNATDYALLADLVNELLATNAVELMQQGDALFYRLVDPRMQRKLADLTKEQWMVLRVIQDAHDRGIWTREIKLKCGLQQAQVTKILKALEAKELVKSVKAVTSKNKKLYLAWDVVPAREITGGSWYNEDQEFDFEFIETLSNVVVQALQRTPRGMSEQEIHQAVLDSGASNVQLSIEDTRCIVSKLLMEFRIEPRLSGYGLAHPVAVNAAFTRSACGVCPLFADCTPGGRIAPETCVYQATWMLQREPEAQDEEMAPAGAGGDIEDLGLV